jgi:hypothetical protein
VSNTNAYGKRLLSIEIAATAEVSPVDGNEAVRLYKYGKKLRKINAWHKDKDWA